jgi:hypothetical protein
MRTLSAIFTGIVTFLTVCVFFSILTSCVTTGSNNTHKIPKHRDVITIK